MTETTNRVVRNALMATNAPWKGDPYRCPSCKRPGYDGDRCKTCGHKADRSEKIQRAREIEKRAIRKGSLGPIKDIVTRGGVGTISIPIGKKGVGKGKVHGTGWAKQRQKHANEPLMGEHLVKGDVLPTWKGNDRRNPKLPDKAIVRGGKVAFAVPSGKGRSSLTSFHDNESKARKVRKAAGNAALECRCFPVGDHAGATAEPRVGYGVGVSASRTIVP
jgi:hypothetical protein